MTTVNPSNNGFFQLDNRLCREVQIFSNWFLEHDIKYITLKWLPQSPEHNQTENLCNIGSLEIHAYSYISAKLKTCTDTYKPLQFSQFKLILEAVKLQQLLFLVTHSMICRYTVSTDIAKFSHNYLRNIMLWIQNNFYTLRDLKTDSFEHTVTYSASYSWVFLLSLLGSSRNIALHLSDEQLWYEPHATTVRTKQLKSA